MVKVMVEGSKFLQKFSLGVVRMHSWVGAGAYAGTATARSSSFLHLEEVELSVVFIF